MTANDAVRIANERLWAAHPELGRRQLTLGADDAALRQEWTNYYREARQPVPPPRVTPTATELSPAVQSDVVTRCVVPESTKPRPITSVVMKRKHIDLNGEDKYGHWWMEIDGTESYGWWPKTPVGLRATLGGTDGELNGQSRFGGTATLDPHHGDKADEEFHPVVQPDDKRTEDEIKDCLRGFAKGYSGEWRWTLGAGQNCHTFQEAAMTHCGVEEP